MGIFTKKDKYYVNSDERERSSGDLLQEFKQNFENDRNAYNQDAAFNYFEQRMRGSSTTLPNINSTSTQDVKGTNLTRNIITELIESKVDTSVPTVIVKPKKRGMEKQAEMIKEKILFDIESMPFTKIADKNERNTYANGLAVTVLSFNSKLGMRDEVGEKELVDYHPKQAIPQNSIYDIEDMDRFSFILPRTKASIKHDYDIEITASGEDYPEANVVGPSFAEGPDSSERTMITTNDDNDLVDQCIVFYYDDDHDVGIFSWVGDEILDDLPKYSYPRMKHCDKCGADNPQTSTECVKCGSEKLKLKIITEITIQEDMELSPIVYNETKQVIQYDESGTVPIGVTTETEPVIKRRLVPKDTVIDIPAIKELPIAVRINVPRNFSFRGRSDVELINDAQVSINKIYSRIEEKILSSSNIIAVDKNMKQTVTNKVQQIWTGSANEIGNIKVFDTEANIQQDIIMANQLASDCTSTIGVTPSYQGKYDPSAKSGTAKKMQIDQTVSILKSTQQNKYDYYAKLYELMFRFDVNFTNEEREYYTEGIDGKPVYKSFNRYELLMQDASGKWYFCTDFIIKATRGQDIPSDKLSVWEYMTNLFQTKAIGEKKYWQIMDKLGFPYADFMLEQEPAEIQQMMAQILGTLSSLSPEEREQILQLPIEQQLEALKPVQEGVEQ